MELDSIQVWKLRLGGIILDLQGPMHYQYILGREHPEKKEI